MQQEGTHLVSVSAWKEREVLRAPVSCLSVRGVVGAGPLRGLVDELVVYRERALSAQDVRLIMGETGLALPTGSDRVSARSTAHRERGAGEEQDDTYDGGKDEFCPRPGTLLPPCCLRGTDNSGTGTSTVWGLRDRQGTCHANPLQPSTTAAFSRACVRVW